MTWNEFKLMHSHFFLIHSFSQRALRRWIPPFHFAVHFFFFSFVPFAKTRAKVDFTNAYLSFCWFLAREIFFYFSVSRLLCSLCFVRLMCSWCRCTLSRYFFLIGWFGLCFLPFRVAVACVMRYGICSSRRWHHSMRRKPIAIYLKDGWPVDRLMCMVCVFDVDFLLAVVSRTYLCHE